jgi:hypothetical protein
MSEFQTGVATLPFRPRMADADEITGESVISLQTGFGPVTPRAVTIMSCHFLPCTNRFWHSGRREFFLPAASKDKNNEIVWTYCTVFDSQQWVANISSDNIGPNAVPVSSAMPMPVTVESIIHDLVSQWGYLGTGQMTRYRLGIFPIAGRMGTAEEKKKALKFQEAACRAIVEEADRIHASGKGGPITELHRGALDWLGSEKRSWYKPIEMGRNKKSVATGNIIPMEALVDGAVDLIEFYVRHNLNPKDYGDEYLANKTHLLDAARKRMFPGAQTKQ